MAERQWTEDDFMQLAKPRFDAGRANPATFGQELAAFFAEAFNHYDSATEGGKAYIDHATEGLTKLFEASLQNTVDTPDTRRLKRAVSLVRRKHFRAKDLMEVFETIHPSPAASWMSRAVEVLTAAIQTLLDIMHDVTRTTHTGGVSLARIGLFYWLMDELIAAQSLARRNHSTLAYTHLRCTMEILDKVELFGEKPDLAELWMSGNEQAIWRKLSPARVREQLTRGTFDPTKKSYDPLYEYLSQQGSHSTFTALKSRFRAHKETDGTLGIAFVVGGFSQPSREISILMYCIMLANLAIMRAVSAFPRFLNPDEVTSLVIAVSDETFGFFSEFLAQIDQGGYERCV